MCIDLLEILAGRIIVAFNLYTPVVVHVILPTVSERREIMRVYTICKKKTKSERTLKSKEKRLTERFA